MFALQAHASAALDAALLVPRLLLRPPTETDWSPTLGYGRVPLVNITAPSCEPDASGCQAVPVCEDAPVDAAPADEAVAPETIEDSVTDAVEDGSATE